MQVTQINSETRRATLPYRDTYPSSYWLLYKNLQSVTSLFVADVRLKIIFIGDNSKLAPLLGKPCFPS
jgi:hypothetical protein